MAVLSNDELNVIRENAKCNVTDNDTWGNETVVSLINTIEAQQQEIEIQTINARTYMQEAENLQLEIEQKSKALEKAKEALKDAEPYTQYSAEDRVQEALAEIDKVLNNTNSEVRRNGRK